MATIFHHPHSQAAFDLRSGIFEQISALTAPGGTFRVVGFGNAGNNCWCNALLQMVVHIPSLRTAYEAFASHYQHSADHAPHATLMLRALEQYEACLQTQTPVPISVSQDVRSALHHFFSKISPLASQNEDAHEALTLLMGGYQEVVERSGIPFAPSLYTPMRTDRLYDEPTGLPRAADPNHRDAYSRLSDDLTSSHSSPEYQILIDLQNRTHLSFPELLKTYFRTEHDGSDLAIYLRPDDRIQDFGLKEERRQFQSIPQELILSVKRFGFNPVTEEVFKINDPVAVPRSFSLPPEATLSGEEPVYDLDLFVVHDGASLSNGHYIAYRNLGNIWSKCDDSTCTPQSEWDVEQVLKNLERSDATSYIHYYKLRTQERLEEGLASRAEIAQIPPLSRLAESSFFRRLPQELNEVEDWLKKSKLDDPVVRRIQLWHEECAPLRRSSLNPSELQEKLVTELENALRDPENPRALFSSDLFGKNIEPVVQFMVRKMRTPKSLFFSERIKLAVEFHEIKDHLSQCDLNDSVAYGMQHWYEGFSPLLMDHQINTAALRERSISSFEKMLKWTEIPHIPFFPVHFGKKAGPMAAFLIGKMRDKASPFFSSRIDEAAPGLQQLAEKLILRDEELILRERVERIEALRAQREREKAKAAQEEQELRDRVRQLEIGSNAQLAAINDQFHTKVDPLLPKTDALEQMIPEQEKKLEADIEKLEQEVVDLKESTKQVWQENAEVQEGIKEVKEEHVQLNTATANLEKAIEKKQKEIDRNTWIQVGLAALSMVLTYGACTALGVSVQVSRAGAVTMAGITAGAAGSGGKHRGPPKQGR